LSKYSAGVYSTLPADWTQPDQRLAKIADAPVPGLELDTAEGSARVETYTIIPHKDGDLVVVVGRLDVNGWRFVANAKAGDLATLEAARARDPLGRAIAVQTDAEGMNRFRFTD